MGAVSFGIGAAPPASAQSEAARQQVTLLHWWTAPSELAALDALSQAVTRHHPDLELRATDARSHGGGARIFLAVSAAMAAGRPPDAIFVNGGAPLQPYVDAGLLSPLDDLWRQEGLERVVPASVRAMSRIGNSYYAVPIDVHRNNLVWYNRALLDEHGIDPASLGTWEALFAAALKLRAAGLENPIQLGSNWTMSLVLEGTLAGMGPSVYEDFINGRITDAADPRLLEAFGILETYLSYARPDHLGTSWNEAIQRLIRREAAFCVMGDWANGEFKLAGLRFGRDYGAFPVPGTRGLYGATVDSFAQARDTVVPENSARLMRTAASREALDAFNAVKGSISPRTDADLSLYGAYQRTAIADFKAAKVIYPNLAGATHDAFKAGVDNVMVGFRGDGDVRKAAAAVAQLAARSQNKFAHHWTLE